MGLIGVNLRNFKGEYSIGLDLGTASVGWAVTDADGRLLHFKKQPTWGSRLFDGASTAAEARSHRGQRRRYVRRRWRLDLLQGLLQEEVERVDPDFFLRLRQSRLVQDDPNKTTSGYRWPIFNDSDFCEIDYYSRFPTIYHLRSFLMKTEEQADIRLIYLALHNIVKCRGNFLREGQDLSAENADPSASVAAFSRALAFWCEGAGGESGFCDEEAVVDILVADGLSNTDRRDSIASLLKVSFGDTAADKKLNKALASAMVGLKTEFKDLFPELRADTTKVALSDDEHVESLLEACPDEGRELFEALRGVYSAYVLQGLLSYAPGKTISENMIAKYDQYGEDLTLLKDLVRQYKGREGYERFFRGPLRAGSGKYDACSKEIAGYTKYNLGKTSYDDFAREVKGLFVGTEAENDPRFLHMMEAFGNQRFLRRLKTSDNGSICYQLHLEEMRVILDNQGRFYPVLRTEGEKILSLVTFRIPYYVGPLTKKNARLDAHDKPRFAWSERKPGMEQVAITPWNWEDVIDKNKSAENFIMRMTGTCAYLQGEDVLPKSSLLYEEFCVLNELNGMRWTADGDDERRFDEAQRKGIIEDLFHRYKTVSYKRIESWLKENGYAFSPHVLGGQGETGLESKMASYIFFAKDVLGVSEISDSDRSMVEEIILWSTLFEDRSILKEKLQDKYGSLGSGRLDDVQIKEICRKRLAGWGRLSKKFLTGLRVDSQLGRKSIMDVLRDGDPNSNLRRGRTMVLMEILHDDDLGFQKEIDAFNSAYFDAASDALGINDLPGSPAVRRTLNQAVKIVDEIVRIVGRPPANVFIEVTREDDMRKKGSRTKRRYDALKTAVAELKSQDPQLWSEIQGIKPDDLDERLTLYFMQGGKCMYSRKPIDISQLHNTGRYEVDHIIPQSYVKDDSLENKVLVLREENQRKTNEMLIDPAVRKRMAGYWRSLHDVKLMGDKKFKNLTRSTIGDNAARGFIARQLVETSQTVKFAQMLLAAKYPDAKILPVKASLSHNLRESAGWIKCREANDFHHAHDAYLACCMGLFVQRCYPGIYERPIAYARAMKKYVQEQAESLNAAHKAPGSGGFIVGSFTRRHVDNETGEITWDGPEMLDRIYRALNYRQCYISRMPQEDTGVFWDATIYSPRDPSKGDKLSLPLKEDLDPRIYGGYSREQFAYFFIYEVRDKKGRRLFRFAGVPVWLAQQVGEDGDGLLRYAREIEAGGKFETVAVQRPKVRKRQLVEVNGERFFVTGGEEVRNAVQLAVSIDEAALLKRSGESGDGLDSEALADMTRRLLYVVRKRLKELSRRIDVDKIESKFGGLDNRMKVEVLIGILSIAGGASNVVDLTALGGSKNSGRIRPPYPKLLSDPETDFYIIDQSVTGMFERRTRVGL